jgi:hypothetical protein
LTGRKKSLEEKITSLNEGAARECGSFTLGGASIDVRVISKLRHAINYLPQIFIVGEIVPVLLPGKYFAGLFANRFDAISENKKTVHCKCNGRFKI